MRPLKMVLIALIVFVVLPLTISATNYMRSDRAGNWQTADRSSSGILPGASEHPDALVRIFAARTVRWRGIFAVHSWIVFKEADAPQYSRYDYTAWGKPIRVNGFAADGRWFGQSPETVFAADGDAAARLIPDIKNAISAYKFNATGDYRAWPRPNSNTFIAAILDAVPGMKTTLPPTAIGRDYPYDRSWIGLTPSRTGIRATLGGYFGITIGWLEGLEINLLGGVIGLDFRRPALKLPGLGRIGMSPAARA